MDLHVSLDGTGNLADQIHQQIRAAITEGRIRPGEALPSTRELARRLAVSRNTVGHAYERLLADGLVDGRAGVGTFVSHRLQSAGLASAVTGRPNSPLRPAPVWDEVTLVPRQRGAAPDFDLCTDLPNPQLFPFGTWRTLLSRHLHLRTGPAETRADPAGHHALRSAIARYLSLSRGVMAAVDDVFITHGRHEAIELATRVVMRPGDVVAVEDPGDREIYGIFTSLGGVIAGVPVDTEGLIVEAIPEGARVAYVCPSHQFPLGVSMSLARRRALVEWAERVDGVIIEDDRGHEFRLAGRPIDPLQNLDRGRRVVYVGSLARVTSANLRLGLVIAPASLHAALYKAKQVSDSPADMRMHAAAAQFIDDGLLARHIRRIRAVYAERHHRLVGALHQELAGYVTPIESGTGLHIAAEFKGRNGDEPEGDVAVVKRAMHESVAVTALSVWSVGSTPRRGLVLGYGAIQAERIEEGVHRLRRCLD